MIGKLACRMMGHSINRRRVWHDGYDFRTTCRRCNQPLIRDIDGWRPFDAERDAKLDRDAHPKSPQGSA